MDNVLDITLVPSALVTPPFLRCRRSAIAANLDALEAKAALHRSALEWIDQKLEELGGE